MIWCSKLQTEIVLSTAEAEYIAMSHALCKTIPVQNLIKEIHCTFDLPNPMTEFDITHHEENLSAIAMAESLKIYTTDKAHSNQISSFSQSSKYIVNKSGDIKLKYISTKKQLADIFTKPVDADSFFTLRKLLSGW